MLGKPDMRDFGAGPMSGPQRCRSGGFGVAQAALEPSSLQGTVDFIKRRSVGEAGCKKIIGPDFGLLSQISCQIFFGFDALNLVRQR
jgi:hypothetical protein